MSIPTTKPLRICHIAPEFQAIPVCHSGGIEQVVQNVAESDDTNEHHIICPRHPTYPDNEERNGVHYHRIHLSALYKRLFKKITRLDPYPYVQRVAKYIQMIEPDILHIHNRADMWAAIEPRLHYSDNQKPRVIFHVHNQLRQSLPSGLNCLVGCSDYIVTDLATQWAWRGNCATMYNGVDLSQFCPTPTTQWRSKKYSDKIVIGCVARISKEKGIDLLVQAVVDHLPTYTNIVVLIAGEIRQDKNTEEGRSRYARDTMALADERIEFLNAVPFDEIAAFYNICDIYVQPSRNEALGMSLLEAMACALPVVITRVGGMTEIVTDDSIGLSAEADDAKALAAQIETLLTDQTLRAKLATAAQQRAKGFSWNAVTQQAQAIYTNVYNET